MSTTGTGLCDPVRQLARARTRAGRAAARACGLALAGLCSLALTLPAAHAQAQQAPKQVVEKTVQDAFKVLRDPALKTQPKERLQKLRTIADRVFDWEAMARSSLGLPWRDLSPAQRSEFVDVFKELLAQRYMDDIDRFQGSEELKVGASDQQGEQAVVRTTLITSSREQVPIDYTMHQSAGGWRVDDISVEGVSLVNHYRKTFANYLSNKSFNDLMQQLKRKLGQNEGPKPPPGPP